MVGPARRLLSLECVQNLNTFCVIGCVILSWCHGRVKYFWTPKFAWTHCHDKKFYLTTSLPVALWRLLAGTVMVEGHGIESCHGTAERSQEKVMVLLSVGARWRYTRVVHCHRAKILPLPWYLLVNTINTLLGVPSFARFWRWGFGEFLRLVGHYCSYLLPKQAGGDSPNSCEWRHA